MRWTIQKENDSMKALTSYRKGMNMKSVRLPALAALLLAPLSALQAAEEIKRCPMVQPINPNPSKS